MGYRLIVLLTLIILVSSNRAGTLDDDQKENAANTQYKEKMRAIVPCNWSIDNLYILYEPGEKAALVTADESPFLEGFLQESDSVAELDLIDCDSCKNRLLAVSTKAEKLESAKVYFNMSTGSLLKAVFTGQFLDDTCLVEFTSTESENKLTKGGERYLVLYDSIGTDLFSILEACVRDPLSANKTVVQLVEWKHPYGSNRPVWIIQSIGIDPPLEPIGGGRGNYPTYMFTRCRQVIDALTGRILLSSTDPLVQLKREDRARLFPGTIE